MPVPPPACRGVHIGASGPCPSPQDAALAAQQLLQSLGLADLAAQLQCSGLASDGPEQVPGSACAHVLCLALPPALAMRWTPAFDTLQLCQTLQLDTVHNTSDLQREIVVAMLASPIAHIFPSVQEFVSAVRIKVNTVQAARKTMLAFETASAERPTQWWAWDEDCGFVIRQDANLITALTQATQPDVSGALYSFSCYRASEYVMLLGLAQELAQCNPPLYAELEALWRQRPIKSGEFHEVFLREQGSMEEPIPPHYFVPGDRTWFRNPDGVSAEASGFEGSWVIYLGGGLFTNFWKNDQPYTLQDKCLEIYHWRHGLYFDAEGEERIDEARVAVLMTASRNNPQELADILQHMERYREARGIYTEAGGCIDTTREFARWVCPGTSDMHLPAPPGASPGP